MAANVFSMDVFSPKGITDKDYQQAQFLVDAVQAFDQSIYQTVFILDNFRNNFLYLSDRSFFYGTRPIEEIKAEGYGFFVNNAPEEEADWLAEIHKESLVLLSETPVEERKRTLVSYNFHLLMGKKKLLINHKLTPLALDALGRVWLVLCVSSFSTIRHEMGRTLFGQLSSQNFHSYSLAEHRWIEYPEINLKTEEKNVLVLSARGYSVAEIAEMIYKSEDTIKLYRKQIFEKLNVNNITEALAVAMNYGML